MKRRFLFSGSRKQNLPAVCLRSEATAGQVRRRNEVMTEQANCTQTEPNAFADRHSIRLCREAPAGQASTRTADLSRELWLRKTSWVIDTMRTLYAKLSLRDKTALARRNFVLSSHPVRGDGPARTKCREIAPNPLFRRLAERAQLNFWTMPAAWLSRPATGSRAVPPVAAVCDRRQNVADSLGGHRSPLQNTVSTQGQALHPATRKNV